MKHPSPALCRLLGSFVFFVCGYGFFIKMNKVFSLNLNVVGSITDFGVKGIVLLVVSIGVGAISSLFIGWGIGLNIDIKSEKTDFVITAIWQYLANGSIAWIMLWMLFISKIVGKENAEKFILNNGGITLFNIRIFVMGLAFSLSILLILSVFGQIRYNKKTNFMVSLILSIPVGIFMGYFQLQMLNLSEYGSYGLWAGIIAPFIVIPFSAFMIERDKDQRVMTIERIKRRA